MNHQGFDEQVRKALENINTDHQPDSWSLFEQRLSEASLPISEPEKIVSVEEEFDKMIRAKVANHQPLIQSNHWQMMSKLLDEYWSIGAWLNRYKVLEVSMTTLFLLTFVNVFYIPNKFNFFNKERKSIDEIASTATYGTVTNTTSIPSQPIFLPKNTSSKLAFAKQNSTPYSFLSENNAALVNELSNEKNVITNNPAFSLQDEVKQNPDNISAVQNVKNNLTTIDALPILVSNDVKKKDSELAITRLKIKQQPWHLAVSVVGTYDLNHVSTPEANFYGTYIPSVSQYCNGFGGGVLLSLQRKRLAFETGILYNSKTYAPADVRLNALNNVSANAYVATLPDITIRNIQIPLHLRYDVFQKNRLKIYAMAGVTAHLITQAKYDRSRDFVGYALRPFSIAEPSEPQEIAPKFTDGYLQTGSWFGNIYSTLNGGIGSNYNLSPKISVFGQAQYQYYWSKTGVGPNKDELNAYNFWIGLKKSF